LRRGPTRQVMGGDALQNDAGGCSRLGSGPVSEATRAGNPTTSDEYDIDGWLDSKLAPLSFGMPSTTAAATRTMPEADPLLTSPPVSPPVSPPPAATSRLPPNAPPPHVSPPRAALLRPAVTERPQSTRRRPPSAAVQAAAPSSHATAPEPPHTPAKPPSSPPPRRQLSPQNAALDPSPPVPAGQAEPHTAEATPTPTKPPRSPAAAVDDAVAASPASLYSVSTATPLTAPRATQPQSSPLPSEPSAVSLPPPPPPAPTHHPLRPPQLPPAEEEEQEEEEEVEDDDDGSEQDLSEMMREWDRRGVSASAEAAEQAAEARAGDDTDDAALSPLRVERSFDISLPGHRHSPQVERPATASLVAFREPPHAAAGNFDRPPPRPKTGSKTGSKSAAVAAVAASLRDRHVGAPLLAPPPLPRALPLRPTSSFGVWGPPPPLPPRASSAKTYLPTYLNALNPNRAEAFAAYAFKSPKEAAAMARQSGASLLRAALGPSWDGAELGEPHASLLEERLLAAVASGCVAHLSELLRVAPRVGLRNNNAYVLAAEAMLRLQRHRADVMKAGIQRSLGMLAAALAAAAAAAPERVHAGRRHGVAEEWLEQLETRALVDRTVHGGDPSAIATTMQLVEATAEVNGVLMARVR
jgi:hypothetical protein